VIYIKPKEKKMFKKKVAIAAVFALAGIAAQAQSTYAEVGVGTAKYSEPALSMTPTIARGIFGMNLNDNFAVEAMGATGLSDGTTTYSGVGINLRVDNAFGAYITPKVKLGDSAELFVRAGYTHVNGTATATGNRGSLTLAMSGSSPSFGAGVKFNLSNNSYVVADYMSYYSKDGISVNGYTVGMGFGF
jgi:hypothetical protein